MNRAIDLEATYKASAHRSYCARVARHLINILMIQPELDLSLELNLPERSSNSDAIAHWVRQRVPVGEVAVISELSCELHRVLRDHCDVPL